MQNHWNFNFVHLTCELPTHVVLVPSMVNLTNTEIWNTVWMPLECRVIAYPAGPVPAILDWYHHHKGVTNCLTGMVEWTMERTMEWTIHINRVWCIYWTASPSIYSLTHSSCVVHDVCVLFVSYSLGGCLSHLLMMAMCMQLLWVLLYSLMLAPQCSTITSNYEVHG